ncbi:MAG TPA: carboxypeptidase regulatory-like domain-containing protein, partial [Planctomycetota bacterium]
MVNGPDPTHFLLSGLAAAMAFAPAVAAQQDGSLRGVAFDKDFGAPLAGAVVDIVELALRATTDDQGQFVFAKVPPGRYTLVVAKEGYLRQVRADLLVAAGQLAEVRVELAGDFTDMEEFIVQEVLQVGADTESALLELRFDSASFLDSISSDLMKRAGAGDAAAALRLVAGASVQDGKSAVIRGLPDRYVSSQMNGVRLPTADEDKRAVELDQFPSEVIDNLKVSKTFTPDQQGDASGGAVDVALKGVPHEPAFVRWKVATSHDSQVTGRSNFLTYQGGGVHAFGKTGRERSVQPLGENWDGAVGVTRAEAPLEYELGVSAGGFFDIGNGWRAGGLVSVFYERDSSYYDGGKDDSL